MPDGKTHKKLHDLFYPLPVVSTILAGVWMVEQGKEGAALTGFILVGYYLGNYIHPDLDRPISWKSPILFPIWLWWRIYARWMNLYGGHRSFATHAFLFSTAIRFLWMALPLYIAVYLLLMLWTKESSTALLPGYEQVIYAGLWAYIGLSESDAVHIFFDLIF